MSDIELSTTSLPFDVDKQAAIVGWSLRDQDFGVRCVHAIRPSWFSSPYAGKLFGAIQAIWQDVHRLPSPAELIDHRPFTMEDAVTYRKLQEILEKALRQTATYGLDLLRQEMTDWMHAVIFSQHVQRAVSSYNEAARDVKHLHSAWKVLEEAVLAKTSSTFDAGAGAMFETSASRLDHERPERVAQAQRVISYGVKYLDDALGGIFPNDLIVLGAKSGKGKTTAATGMALSVAHDLDAGTIKGSPSDAAYYFALEAENNEIERRILYGAISAEYYATTANVPGRPYISYTDWRRGILDKVLDPIEERVKPQVRKALGRLQTLYRNSGDFTLATLEKHLLQVVSTARFIVIDHLHYVDDDGDDENKAYKRVIKLVRDIVLRYSVPVAVVAHLRKTNGNRTPTLLPNLEDFHGTSDVPKIATTCIMIGAADDPVAQARVARQPYLLPTYMASVKNRMDGNRTKYVGLVNFDVRTNMYEPSYQIGKLNDWVEDFEPLVGNAVPPFARAATEVRSETTL